MKHLNYKFLYILVIYYYYLIISPMEPDQLKYLKHFILAKRKHVNSCFYEYSPYKLSKQLGFSSTKWNNCVSKFLEWGWCREEISRSGGVNLVFNPLSTVLTDDLKGFKLGEGQWKAQDIYQQLLITLLKNKRDQQEFVVKIKSDLTKPTNIASYKRAKRLASKHGITIKKSEKADSRFVISIYSLAKLFKCSISQASKLMHKLQEDGFLSIITNLSRIDVAIPNTLFKRLDLPSSCFFYKGSVFKRELNEYLILDKGGAMSV